MILDLLPFYKKERISYNSELEEHKIEYKKLKSEIKEKKRATLEQYSNNPEYIISKILWFNRKKRINKEKEIRKFFRKELESLKRKYKDLKLQAKINYMRAVSENKALKERITLTKKSKSNLHQILYEYSRLSYEEKKNSLVVWEISPSKEVKFSIKKRVFNDLNAFNDKSDDRVYAGEKDILFTSIQFGNGNEKIPMVLRYSGACVPVYLEKVRDDTYDKFSSENEHHIILLSNRLREIKAPSKGLDMDKKTVMFILIAILGIGYLAYRYYNGGF